VTTPPVDCRCRNPYAFGSIRPRFSFSLPRVEAKRIFLTRTDGGKALELVKEAPPPPDSSNRLLPGIVAPRAARSLYDLVEQMRSCEHGDHSCEAPIVQSLDADRQPQISDDVLIENRGGGWPCMGVSSFLLVEMPSSWPLSLQGLRRVAAYIGDALKMPGMMRFAACLSELRAVGLRNGTLPPLTPATRAAAKH